MASRVALGLALGVAVAEISPLGGTAARGDATWTGTTSQDWNNIANWSTNPTAPSGNFFINTATGNYPVLSANSAFTPVDLVLGDGSGQSGELDQSAGTLSLNDTGANGNWMFVGRGGGTGTYNLTGTGSLVVGKMWVGGAQPNEGGTGTVNMNTTGSITANSNGNVGFGGQTTGSVIVGWATFPTGTSNATFNLQSGTLNANGGGLWVGAWGSNSVFNQTGGTVNATSLSLGRWFSASSTMNVTNGTVNNSGTTTIAHSGSASDNNHATMNVNAGGIVNSEGDFIAAFAGDGVTNGSTGQLNIATGGTVNVASTVKRWFIVNQWDTIQGQVNVNGGTLNLNSNTDLRFSTGNGTGTSVVNLNSGNITSWSGNKTGTTTTGVVDMNQAGGTGANNTFNLNGGTLSVSQVIANNTNGTAAFNFNGGTLQATNDSTSFVKFGGASQVANVRNGGAIIDSNGHNVAIVQPLVHSTISGDNATDGGLTKKGAGTLSLTGTHTYNGPTSVNAGGLTLASGSIANSSVSVAAGAGFGASGSSDTAAGVSYAGAGTLAFDLGTSGAGNAALLSVTNALNIGSGTVTLNVAHTGPIGSGTYNLATLGSLSGTSGNLVLGTIQGLNTARQTATLNKSSTALTLDITGAAPVWHGATSTVWSTSTADTAWNVNGTDSYFMNGDDVLFDDTAASSTVNVVGTVLPHSLTFNNNTLNYTISGSGTIGGTGTLNTKLGSGSLTINTANTYSGGTTLGGGQLNINNNTALGTGTLTTSGAATVDNTSGAAVTTTNAVALGGDLTVAGTNDLAFNGAISGSAGLVKNGSANLGLGGNNTYTGTTVIHGGTVTVGGGATGTTSANVQIAPAASDTGTLTVTSGTLNASRVIIAGTSTNDTSAGTGVINQSGGTINSNAWFTVGSGGSVTGNTGGTGTYNLTGGTLNVMTQQMEVANFTGTTGTVNMSGASSAINIYNNNFISLGANNNAGDATFNQNGGAVTFYSDAGVTPGGTGSLSLGRAGTLHGTYTYNLNGGTLTVPQITRTAGTGVFNFNGGTLKAGADQTAFVGNLSTANVRNGGAIIDTNGHNVTVGQALLHSSISGDSATDGGLTKNGAGTLTMGGVATYTGNTVINGGTLKLPVGATPVAVGAYSFDELTSGPGLTGGTTVANTGSGGTAMNGTVNHADNQLDNSTGNSSSVTVVPGRFGNAVELDGLGSSIDVPSKIVDQSGTGSWTLSVWEKTSTPGGALLSKNSGANTWNPGNSEFYLGSNPISGTPGSLPTAVRNSGGFVQGDGSVTDNAWHMVTYVDNGGTKQIFVDGVALNMTQTAFDNTDVATLTRLGYSVDTFANFDGTQHFAGDLDEIKFFNTALNGTQVQSLYNSNALSGGGQQYLPAATAVSIPVSGATLDLNDNNQTIGSLSGVAGSGVALGAGTLTTGGSNASTTFAGAISGPGGLTKAGTGTFTLSGSNTYTGATSVTGGKLVVAANLTTSSSVSVGDTATVELASGGGQNRVIKTGSVSVSGSGKIDLKDNKLIVTTAGQTGSWNGSSYNGITGLVAAGRGDGTWNGNGIKTSTAAPGDYTTLGVANATDVKGVTGTGTDTWAGQTVHAGDTLVMYTYGGDANLDGALTIDDYTQIDSSFSAGGAAKGWFNGDFNYDGEVNIDDYTIIDSNFPVQGAPFPTAAGASASPAALSGVTAVPEPASLGLLALGAMSVLGRRSRRRDN